MKTIIFTLKGDATEEVKDEAFTIIHEWDEIRHKAVALFHDANIDDPVLKNTYYVYLHDDTNPEDIVKRMLQLEGVYTAAIPAERFLAE